MATTPKATIGISDETTGVETRYYTGGTLTLALGGEPLATGSMATTTLTTTYNDLANCADDTVALATDAVMLDDQAATSSAPVQAVATALIDTLLARTARCKDNCETIR